MRDDASELDEGGNKIPFRLEPTSTSQCRASSRKLRPLHKLAAVGPGMVR